MHPIYEQRQGVFIIPNLLEESPLAFLGNRENPPIVPNRFLALIPDDPGGLRARELAQAAVGACEVEWDRMLKAVKPRLDSLVRKHVKQRLARDWDLLWPQQVKDFFDIYTASLSRGDCDIQTLRNFLGDGWDPERRQDAEAWGSIELVTCLLDARKLAGRFPAYEAVGHVPQKCTLIGSYEQLGPAHEGDSREFWEQLSDQDVHIGGTRIRHRERLCAISLVKRYAWAAHFARELGYGPDEFANDTFPTRRPWRRPIGLVKVNDSIQRRHSTSGRNGPVNGCTGPSRSLSPETMSPEFPTESGVQFSGSGSRRVGRRHITRCWRSTPIRCTNGFRVKGPRGSVQSSFSTSASFSSNSVAVSAKTLLRMGLRAS